MGVAASAWARATVSVAAIVCLGCEASLVSPDDVWPDIGETQLTLNGMTLPVIQDHRFGRRGPVPVLSVGENRAHTVGNSYLQVMLVHATTGRIHYGPISVSVFVADH